MKLTVVCREEGYDDILIYVVDANPKNDSEVQQAVQDQRAADLDGDASTMEVLFAFVGDLTPIADWRS